MLRYLFRLGNTDLLCSVVILSFSFFIPLLYSVTPWVLVILWEKYIEFFAFDYDSLPISFQSGIAFFL